MNNRPPTVDQPYSLRGWHALRPRASVRGSLRAAWTSRPCRLVRVIAVALALAASARQPLAAADVEPLAELDMAFDDERTVGVAVTVGGAPYRFMLDTGSSSSAFDKRRRALLGKAVGTLRLLDDHNHITGA